MLVKLFSRVCRVVSYGFRFYLGKVQRLIPHPRLRSFLFRLLGAKIGDFVRIEDIILKNQAGWGFNKLEIGDYTVVTQDAVLDLTHEIFIGQKCVIAGTIFTHQDAGSFLFDSPTVRRYPRKVAPVIIGDNVYVAVGSIILCGVEIGQNSVVAAGSLVTQDVPPNTLVAGVPAITKKTFT